MAFERFRMLQPFLEGRATLTEVASAHGLAYRTAVRWVGRYREHGLTGLARQRRTDRGRRRIPEQLQHLIEGLAVQKTKPTAASVHRQVAEVARRQGWVVPSYGCVYDIIRSLDKGLVMLAHEGSGAYRDAYDLVYRREAGGPNEIWQADHSPLPIWLINEEGAPARPWLTVIEDDYSRCISGYFLGFGHPNTQHTALALRQAIWRKEDTRWRICGIPDVFYTDHGSDFTSRHMEQVSADLKMQLVFSSVGIPRGRGKVERFFQTVEQLFLIPLPGYGPAGRPVTPPSLTLPQFETLFQAFLLEEYHRREHSETGMRPETRWESGAFLPQMPESLEQLDLLLLTVARTRRVRRDGIHFQALCYIGPTLADYVGEDVTIRYDPRDLAEIRVFYQERFLCRAVCQELAGQTVSLKEIETARNRRRRELKGKIKERSELVDLYLNAHQSEPLRPPPKTPPQPDTPPAPRLKRYENE